MKTMIKKTMNNPEEVRTFPKGKLELVSFDEVTFGKATFLPGWKWSESIKPTAGTHSCQAPHTNYHLSGRLHVVMDDGSEMEFGPGDIGIIPPGHDAWVVGDEPCVVVDVTGMADYAVRH
jgi:mannose-6-phosphate isomerase-like protein (cupin superfamily)